MSGKGGIYAIVNAGSEEITTYIGSTVSFKIRWANHKASLRHNHHRNPYLQRAWNKYGEECFQFVVLEEINDLDELIPREQYWLDFYRERGEVYNMGKVAHSPYLGRKHTEETRQRIRDSLLGKKHTEGTKRRMREAWANIHIDRSGSKNPFYGKKHTDKARQGMAESKAGYYPSFRNRNTGEIIPLGYNLRSLCREKSLEQSSMWRISQGLAYQYKGWVLASRSEEEIKRLTQNAIEASSGAKSYPALYNVKTGETIPNGKNLARACRERKINLGAMWDVVHGDRSQHKGWILANGQ
jgi:group I intron endonuclease